MRQAKVDPKGERTASAREHTDPTYPHDTQTEKPVLYPQRWVVLTVLCLLNTSNQMAWLSFAPVADVASLYLNVDSTKVNSLSMIFLVAEALLCLPTMWLLDVKGLKFSLIFGAWANAAGSVVRMIGCLEFVPQDFRFPICITGQAIASTAEGIPLFGVTKVAATWFPDSQRGIISSIAAMSNPLGILLSYIVVPLLVKSPNDVQILLIAFACPAVATALVATGGIRSSEPLTPPSSSGAKRHQAFLVSIKQVMGNKQFWILLFSTGAGSGLYTVLFTVLQQELCRNGYENTFSGLCGTLMMAFGIVGGVVTGFVMDKTKRYEEVVKTLCAMIVVTVASYCIVSTYAQQKPLVALAISLAGLCGLAAYPALLVLAAEVTYPAAEAVSCGLVVVSGGLHGTAFLLIVQALAVPTTDAHALTCQAPPYDFTYSNIFLESTMAFAVLILIIFLRPKYKRLEAENVTAKLTQVSCSAISPANNAILPMARELPCSTDVGVACSCSNQQVSADAIAICTRL